MFLSYMYKMHLPILYTYITIASLVSFLLSFIYMYIYIYISMYIGKREELLKASHALYAM